MQSCGNAGNESIKQSEFCSEPIKQSIDNMLLLGSIFFHDSNLSSLINELINSLKSDATKNRLFIDQKNMIKFAFNALPACFTER